VITGEGMIRGRRVCVVACEFGFLGGTIGVAAAERLTVAIERATEERLPLVASRYRVGPVCRKGPWPFCKWSRSSRHSCSTAVPVFLIWCTSATDHRRSVRLLGIARSADRSAARSAHRVSRAACLRGAIRRHVPEGVQVAENLYRLGLVDAVLDPDALSEIAARHLT